MLHVLLLADTHLGPGAGTVLEDRLGTALDEADAILHAGDIIDASVLDVLARHAPTHAVLGNNDRGLVLPERLELPLDGCTVAMVHDSGASGGRAARLRRWFPSADAVVFGHSHIPWLEVHRSGDHDQHHVNPGSATQRRRQPRCTAAWLDLDDGCVLGVRHVTVPS